MNVERNDVDVNKLFNWGKKFEIVGEDGEAVAEVYMRLLGDTDVNRARVYALRKSAELRKKLKDADSEERLIYVREIDELTDKELVDYVVMFSMREIMNNALKIVKVPAPKIPKSNASLEKMEKYQKELDEYPDKLDAALKEHIKKETDKLKKLLAEESKETLYKKYLDSLITEYCELEAMRAYNEVEVYLGCYKDENFEERFFDSLEKYQNLLTETKELFRAAYQKLSIGMDELKKLREATQ